MSANISLKQKAFSINSGERVNGVITCFNAKTPMPYQSHFDKISLLEADIPKSYYHFDSAPTFSITESTGPVTVAVTLTAGRFYSASQLATELKTALDAASVTGGNSLTYTVTYSTTTGKFTIAVSAGETTFLTGSSELLSKYLGFEQSNTANVTSSSTFTGAYIANLQRYDVLIVRSSLADNSGNDELARVYPSDTPDLGVYRYVPADPKLMSVGLSSNATNESQFALTDKDGALIELNGVNWRLQVQLFRDFEKDDI